MSLNTPGELDIMLYMYLDTVDDSQINHKIKNVSGNLGDVVSSKFLYMSPVHNLPFAILPVVVTSLIMSLD